MIDSIGNVSGAVDYIGDDELISFSYIHGIIRYDVLR